jgi:hypothetical protein
MESEFIICLVDVSVHGQLMLRMPLEVQQQLLAKGSVYQSYVTSLCALHISSAFLQR